MLLSFLSIVSIVCVCVCPCDSSSFLSLPHYWKTEGRKKVGMCVCVWHTRWGAEREREREENTMYQQIGTVGEYIYVLYIYRCNRHITFPSSPLREEPNNWYNCTRHIPLFSSVLHAQSIEQKYKGVHMSTHVILSSSEDCLFFGHLSFSFTILNNSRWNSKRWRHSRHVKKVYTQTHLHKITPIEIKDLIYNVRPHPIPVSSLVTPFVRVLLPFFGCHCILE